MAKREKQGKSYLYINTAKHLQLVVKIQQLNIEKCLHAWHQSFSFKWIQVQGQPHTASGCSSISAGSLSLHALCMLSVQGRLQEDQWSHFITNLHASTCYTWELLSCGQNNPRYIHVKRTQRGVEKHWGTAKPSINFMSAQEWMLALILKAALWHEGGRNLSYFPKYWCHSQL